VQGPSLAGPQEPQDIYRVETLRQRFFVNAPFEDFANVPSFWSPVSLTNTKNHATPILVFGHLHNDLVVTRRGHFQKKLVTCRIATEHLDIAMPLAFVSVQASLALGSLFEAFARSAPDPVDILRPGVRGDANKLLLFLPRDAHNFQLRPMRGRRWSDTLVRHGDFLLSG
jgi:hypothetical protein